MPHLEHNAKLLTPKARLSGARLALFGGLTAAVGVVVVVAIFAATSSLSLEAENGTLAGSAKVVTVAGASGGKAVQFGSSTTATPTPTPTPTGGGATRSTNCTPAVSDTMTNTVSHLCGFPDTTNTGVPAGTNLIQVPSQATSGTGWHWDSRGWVVVDGAGAVFSGYEVHSSVLVSGAGATIKNCRIIDTGNDIGVSIAHANNVTISHNTISGATNGGADDNRLTIAVKDTYGDVTGAQVIGNNIWDVSAGITIDDGLVQDNYIHDMGYNSADHVDSTQSFSKGNLLVQHNTLLNQQGQTATMLWSTTLGAQGNHTANDNLLAGGGYTIYVGNDAGAPNQKVTNNHFSKMFYPNCGYYGIESRYNASAPGAAWTGNVWDDSGAVVGP